MSQRLGSSIASTLFMADPVPIRRNGNSNSPHSSDQSFLIKGEESQTTNNTPSVNIASDDAVMVIDGGSFKLNRETLKEALQELKTQAHVSLRQLSPEHTESFRSIVEALRLLYGSQGLYDVVLNDIRTVFNDVKDVKPGTVAAFFIGCFNDDKFPGPMGCSPKCAASLPPTEGTPGYNNCDDLVLIYSDGLFSSLNEKQSSHAYIYIGDAEFTGFTPENVNQLRGAGIENTSLIFGNQDGSYREVTGALTLDQLPRKTEITQTPKSDVNTKNQPGPTDTGGSSSGAGIVFAIIIVVIIILLLIVLYRTYNPRW
ncbi:Hypothetical protein HVR_LOCUS1373 [uncultured virus]|nr:Hypothetical protein HVR_LOCUS1373 [uncultured virus]